MPVVERVPTGVARPKPCRLAVELSTENARFRTDDLRYGVDADALHALRVDHQAAIANSVAGDAMPAALYRHQKVVRARELDRGDDVGSAGAARDQRDDGQSAR
jgi:hypothetical protein